MCSPPLSPSMKDQLRPIDKRPALMIDIVEGQKGGLLIHTIQIIYQRYRNSEFSLQDSRHRFMASNGFRLVSDSTPEVGENNSPTAGSRSSLHYNRLFVGGNCTYADRRIVTAYSQSFIGELMVAVKEYNEHRLGN